MQVGFVLQSIFLEEPLTIDIIVSSQKIGQTIFSKNHAYFTTLYETFYRTYLKNCMLLCDYIKYININTCVPFSWFK